MADIAEIEASIEVLPTNEFFSLLDWMAERHLKMLSSEDFEMSELENELLKSLDSPRHVVNENLFEGIRMRAAEHLKDD